MRFFFTAGEASGDMYGARLLQELKKIHPNTAMQLEAIGGAQLKAAGAQMIADSSRWGAMGIIQSLKVVPRVLRGYLVARKQMKRGDPGVHIPIDFGFLNVRLARHAREYGWRVLYFIPPGSWRRSIHGEGLAEITDEVVTPFAWSSGVLSAIGVHVHWYGHPLKQIVHEEGSPWTGPESTTIAILPGSRLHEIKRNLKAVARASEFISKSLSFEIAVSSTFDRNAMADLWRRYCTSDRKVTFSQGQTLAVLNRARAAIICSGTATLEAALCRCPMVVIYKVSPFMELEAKVLRINPEYISLPNIICNRKVVPELIQSQAKPKAIATELLQLVEEGPFRETQLRAFEQIYNDLGGNDALTRTASLALKMISI